MFIPQSYFLYLLSCSAHFTSRSSQTGQGGLFALLDQFLVVLAQLLGFVDQQIDFNHAIWWSTLLQGKLNYC